jgi:hypothetical protein
VSKQQPIVPHAITYIFPFGPLTASFKIVGSIVRVPQGALEQIIGVAVLFGLAHGNGRRLAAARYDDISFHVPQQVLLELQDALQFGTAVRTPKAMEFKFDVWTFDNECAKHEPLRIVHVVEMGGIGSDSRLDDRSGIGIITRFAIHDGRHGRRDGRELGHNAGKETAPTTGQPEQVIIRIGLHDIPRPVNVLDGP